MTPWVSTSVLGLAYVGSVTSAIYAALVVAAAHRFGRRRQQGQMRAATFFPRLSVLKPLHGAEPGLEENLRSFFTQDYPGGYELLFCARHAGDAGLAIARSVAAEFPGSNVRFLTCGEPQFPNPKMYSLAVMAQAADADILVTSDADARIAPDHLQRLAQELKDPEVDLAFSLYLGRAQTPETYLYLDALGKSVEMNAGVLVADMLAGTDFSLGVTVIQRREVFELVGGFDELGSYWAEDFVLGHRLAEQGRGVRISTEVIELVVTAASASQSFLNQLRWAQSTRRSRPLGHLGTGLTFAMPFGLLGMCVELAHGRLWAAFAFLLFAVVQRAALAWSVLRALGSATAFRDACVYPVRDVYGFVIWLASFLPASTRYHGTSFRIMPDGRLQAESVSR
ncbi:glycosyltransferase [Terriglobus aquaticus]|uniref:Glycosyltransferase n=1 Tax=Terriglobus aquaticus TaxID=940139 RepID=A0ABW9KHY7_9BACT|nr:glycosyltransferase [Terriglobus aquaticus]